MVRLSCFTTDIRREDSATFRLCNVEVGGGVSSSSTLINCILGIIAWIAELDPPWKSSLKHVEDAGIGQGAAAAGRQAVHTTDVQLQTAVRHRAHPHRSPLPQSFASSSCLCPMFMPRLRIPHRSRSPRDTLTTSSPLKDSSHRISSAIEPRTHPKAPRQIMQIKPEEDLLEHFLRQLGERAAPARDGSVVRHGGAETARGRGWRTGSRVRLWEWGRVEVHLYTTC